MNYKIIARNNGEMLFCIQLQESETELMVMFPMVLEKHLVPITETTMRETYSASQLCPFTEDRVFTFYKPELLYVKPLSAEAIPFYVNMINKHETIDTMQKYNIQNLIDADSHVDGAESLLGNSESYEAEVLEELEDLINSDKTIH